MVELLVLVCIVVIVNLVVYNCFGGEINNVWVVVMWLGFCILNIIMMLVIVCQLGWIINNFGMCIKLVQLWEYCVYVVVIVYVLIFKLIKVDLEMVMFVGIVYEVGGFYLFLCMDDFLGLFDGGIEDWMEYGEKMIGCVVFKKLGVLQLVVDVIEFLWYGVWVLLLQIIGDVLLLVKELLLVFLLL